TIAAAAPEFVRELAVDVQSSSNWLDLAVTTDGSEPTLRSPRPALPLHLAQTATVKARAFHRGEPVTPVVERTFAKVAPWSAAAAAPGALVRGASGHVRPPAGLRHRACRARVRRAGADDRRRPRARARRAPLHGLPARAHRRRLPVRAHCRRRRPPAARRQDGR